MKLDGKCQEIDDTSDRVNKYIRYFRKELAADKFRLCMVCVIIILVALLILALALPDKTVISDETLAKLNSLPSSSNQ